MKTLKKQTFHARLWIKSSSVVNHNKTLAVIWCSSWSGLGSKYSERLTQRRVRLYKQMCRMLEIVPYRRGTHNQLFPRYTSRKIYIVRRHIIDWMWMLCSLVLLVFCCPALICLWIFCPLPACYYIACVLAILASMTYCCILARRVRKMFIF